MWNNIVTVCPNKNITDIAFACFRGKTQRRNMNNFKSDKVY